MANSLWIGNVSLALTGLSWVEHLLIAKVEHNSCFVRVSSGHRKMVAHVMAFESPIQKIYTALPPPIEDLDEVLTVIFTGSCTPNKDDFKWLQLLLVQRDRVTKALEWLKLNHIDYTDLEISYKNLTDYSEDTPPVAIQYLSMKSNKLPDVSQFDDTTEDGVETGDVPFVVHGLTGEQLNTKSTKELKGSALKHWNAGGKALMIGREGSLKSIHNDLHLYSQIFPWLFPYELGGIGSTKLSDKDYKQHLLMYYDKCFQCDPNFTFVAFSHEQVKASTQTGLLMTDLNKFHDIADRLLNPNT